MAGESAFGAHGVAVSHDIAIAAGALSAASFPTQTQQRDNWCWAAVSAALLPIFHKAPMQQCEIVTQFKGVASCPPNIGIDESAILDDVFASLQLGHRYHSREFLDDVDGAIPEIRAELEAGRPVPITISWGPDSNNHYVCAFAYAQVDGEPALWIFDPWRSWAADGNKRLRTVASMTHFEQERGSATVGEWIEAYFMS
jgi:hypothetical protein